jgi:hypothetical protein
MPENNVDRVERELRDLEERIAPIRELMKTNNDTLNEWGYTSIEAIYNSLRTIVGNNAVRLARMIELCEPHCSSEEWHSSTRVMLVGFKRDLSHVREAIDRDTLLLRREPDVFDIQQLTVFFQGAVIRIQALLPQLETVERIRKQMDDIYKTINPYYVEPTENRTTSV